MNGGKPCEGNDTETARSCFAPCPGVSFVKKQTNISSPSGTMRMSFIYSFIYSFFFHKTCSEINFIEVQKNALKLKYCFFSSFGATFV